MKTNIFILTAILVLTGFAANSQSNGASFGIRGGINFQNFNGKDINGDKLSMNMVTRFNVGAVVEIPIAADFYVQPGLLFTTKGAKSTDHFLGMDMSAEYNLSYIEMPVNLLYKPLLGNGHLLLGFGPYLAYAVGGKATFVIENNSTVNDIVFTKEYESDNPYEYKYFRHFDYGANFLFGYEIAKGLSAQLNAQLGLAQINANNTTYPDNKTMFKNTGFGISLGYNF
jgi:hypothetical protein